MKARSPTAASSNENPPDAAHPRAPWWARPAFGNAFAIAAGVAFLVVCMLLPLVGKAGAVTSYADQNRRTFMTALAIALALALAATALKWARRRYDGSPRPWVMMGLAALCVLMWLALLGGWLAI